MPGMREQLRNNMVALISLVIEDDEAFARIDGAIDVLRQDTLESLRAID